MPLTNDITEKELISTLADEVESYMLEKLIFNEKYYPSFLKYGANAWSELFYDTLYIFQARWLPVTNVNGKNIVKFPKDCKGFISANLVNECNITKRIPLNTQINTIDRPQLTQTNTVSCQDFVSSFVATTLYLFTNQGVDYYQTTYLQYCANGDIIQRTVTPTKKYLDYVGDNLGDYNNDHNNDYSLYNPTFSNFKIENVVDQTILTNLDTDENGCPINSTSNFEKLNCYCGCYSNIYNNFLNNCCSSEVLYNSTDTGCYGCVTLSEDQRCLIYTPPSSFTSCSGGVMPQYIMVYFKGSALGNEITGAAIIPDDWHIKNALTLGIEYYSIRINNKFTQNEKTAARAAFDDAINKLIVNKMDMSLSRLTNITEPKTKW